jgi:hypothetical protein
LGAREELSAMGLPPGDKPLMKERFPGAIRMFEMSESEEDNSIRNGHA